MMSKRTMMIILAVIFTLAGFATSSNLLGTRLRTISVHNGDVFYKQPSLHAESCTALFNVGEELLVIDKVELKAPTAVVMLKTQLVEDKEHVHYKLAEGAVYKIADAQLEKPGSKCRLALKTTKGLDVELEVAKDWVKPVDEGTWLRVRKKGSNSSKDAEGWMLQKTQWN